MESIDEDDLRKMQADLAKGGIFLKKLVDDRLKELENQKVIIYPISFIIDNSETVFELDIEYRNIAKKFNIKDFTFIEADTTNK